MLKMEDKKEVELEISTSDCFWVVLFTLLVFLDLIVGGCWDA